MNANELLDRIGNIQSGGSLYLGVTGTTLNTTYTLLTGRPSPRVVFGRSSLADLPQSIADIPQSIADALDQAAIKLSNLG